MSGLGRWRRWLAFALAAMMLLSCAARTRAALVETIAGVDGKWRRYESANFELFSHATDGESRRLLHRLELLRAVFAETVRLRERQPNPLTIYLFDRAQDFRAYLPENLRKEGRLAGFYLHRPDRSVIVVSATENEKRAQGLIFHEYIHHLTEVNGDTPALWYVEGIAEYFSTIEMIGKNLAIGQSIVEHVELLQKSTLMPLETLFAVGHDSSKYHESEPAGLFYAESWALVHYLMSGPGSRDPATRVKRARFLQYVRSEGETGDPTRRKQLWLETMGSDYAKMVRELTAYVDSGSYTWMKISAPEIPREASYAMTGVQRDEIRRRLAELGVRVNRDPTAKLEMLNAATAPQPDVRALEVLGTDAWAEGDARTAQERWEQALAAGSKNPAVMHQVAAIEGQQWFGRLDVHFRLPDATADRLRRLLMESIRVSPNQTQAFELLAWVEATVKEPVATNVALVEEHLRTLRPRDKTLVALALGCARRGDFSAGRKWLAQAENETSSSQIRGWVERLREDFARREAEGVEAK